MIRIENKTNMVIPVLLPKDSKLEQVNIYPGESVDVKFVTSEIFRLADPTMNCLELTRIDEPISIPTKMEVIDDEE